MERVGLGGLDTDSFDPAAVEPSSTGGWTEFVRSA
jgi:hypothetical protein